MSDNLRHDGVASILLAMTLGHLLPPSVHQLALKTVNGARSAYVCFLFQRSFFHSYSDRRTGARDRREGKEEDEEEEALKCKITIKVRLKGHLWAPGHDNKYCWCRSVKYCCCTWQKSTEVNWQLTRY